MLWIVQKIKITWCKRTILKNTGSQRKGKLTSSPSPCPLYFFHYIKLTLTTVVRIIWLHNYASEILSDWDLFSFSPNPCLSILLGMWSTRNPALSRIGTETVKVKGHQVTRDTSQTFSPKSPKDRLSQHITRRVSPKAFSKRIDSSKSNALP